MKISFSLSGMLRGVPIPFSFDSPEFKKLFIGMPIYFDNYNREGHIADICPELDLVIGEIPDCEYSENIIDLKGCNSCEFEIVRE